MKRITSLFALVASTTLGLAACGGGGDPLASESPAGEAPASGEVVVGSADFPESELLAEIYAAALNKKGVKASTKPRIGARAIYLKALEDGSIQVVPEYTGSLAFQYDKTYAGTDPQEVYDKAAAVIPKNFALLERSEAEDKDGMVVTKKTADEKGLKSIEDLAPIAGDLTIGAPPEFQTKKPGIGELKSAYGVTFGSFRQLKEQGLVQALKNGQVDVANVFSTDPAIPANDFVVLEDTKKVFGSQNIVPLVAKGSADTVRPALDEVSKGLTTDVVADLLKQVVIDKKDAKQVAAAYVKK